MNAQNTAVGRLAIGLTILSFSSLAFAQAGKKTRKAPPSAAQSGPTQIVDVKPVSGNDKVDISDLEKKYWAPKDTDFSVVQNRTYSKVHKFTLTPQWGRLINDPYSESNIYALTANYFWSERMGIQAQYLSADLSNNNAVSDLSTLATTSGARPDHGKIRSYYGLGYTLIPFYAKMSFWGTKIIYFDMAFTPMLGMTQYDQQIESGNQRKSTLTYGLDITQYFFFSRWFAIRADLRNQWRSEEIVKYRGATVGQKVTDKLQQDTMFLIGGMFYF